MKFETNKKSIIEAALIAMIAAFCGISIIYIPILSILVFIMPVPFIILSARQRTRYTILAIIITSLLIGILTDIIFTLFILIVFAPVSIIMGGGFKKKQEPSTTIGLATFSWVITTFTAIQIISIIGGFNFVEQIRIAFTNTLQQQSETLMSLNISIANIQESIEHIILIIPAILIIQLMIGAFINYYIANSILKRLRFDSNRLIEFSRFKFPSSIVLGSFIIFLLSYLTRFVEGIPHKVLLQNVTVIFIFVFYVQGMALISFFLKNRLHKAIRMVILAFIVIINPLLLIVALLGLIDAVFDIRKLSISNE